MPKKTREQRQAARARRKQETRKRLARQNRVQWEDALVAHEMNVERLNTLPADLRTDDHEEAVAKELQSIGILEHSIDLADEIIGDEEDTPTS